MRAFLHLAAAALLACEPSLPPAAASPPPAAPAPAPASPAPANPAPASPAPASPAPALRSAAGIEYVELLTGPAGSEDRLPMIVAIHGLGDRPEHFAGLLVGLPVAARVILPRGLDPVDDGFSWFPIRARSSDIAGLSRGIAGAGDRLVPFVRELVAARPTVGKPVVTGFSQGGMLSFYLAVAAPELFAAAVPVGGWLPPPLWPTDRPAVAPTIVALHGEADTAVKFAPTREAVDKLKQLGWPAELKSWPEVGHAIPPPIRRELFHQLTRALP